MAISPEIEKLERRWMENPTGLMFVPVAEGYRKAGDPTRALEILSIGLDKHTGYVPALVCKGRCHLDQSALKEAEVAFNSALDGDPVNAIALRGLAEVYERTHRGSLAVERLELLVEVDRSDTEARAALVRLRSESGATVAEPAAEAEAGESLVEEQPAASLEQAQPVDLPGFEPTGIAAGQADEADSESDLPFVIPEDPPADIGSQLNASAAGDRDVVSFEDPFSDTIGELSGYASGTEAVPGGTQSRDPEPADAPKVSSWESWASWKPPAPAEPPRDQDPEPVSIDDSEPQAEPEAVAEAELTGAAEVESDAPFDRAADLPADVASDAEVNVEDVEVDTVEAYAEPQNEADSVPAESSADEDGDLDEGDFGWWSPPVAAARENEPSEEFLAELEADELPDDEHGWMEPEFDDLHQPVVEAQQVESDSGAGEEPAEAVSFEEDAELPSSAPVFEPVAAVEPEPEPEMEPLPSSEQDVAEESHAVLSESEPADAGDAELIVTESMAELFVRQGHTDLALAVYRQLSVQAPDADHLREAIARLEVDADQSPPAAEPVRTGAASKTGGRPVSEMLRAVLDAPPPAAVSSVLPPAIEKGIAGVPTRASGDPLPLSAVFGEEAPAPPAGGQSASPDGAEGEEEEQPEAQAAEPSYDEFFGGTRQDADTAPAADAQEEEDLRQFNSWLRGLKR